MTEIDRLARAARRIVDRTKAQAREAELAALDDVIVGGIAELLVLAPHAVGVDDLQSEAVTTARSALEVFRTDARGYRRG